MARKVEVVVVDDDDSVRWVMEQALEMANIEHVSAGKGCVGLELINKHTPPLAILDVKMGSLSGLDVARQMESNTKVLLVTGYAEAIRDKVANLPVVAILEKPFDLQCMIQLVEKALGKIA